MADLKLIKPLGLQNIINKFCFTIGMIPSSYKLSLTYEEQILSIGKYLEETVIPALNNNAEAVAELQALFVQLKDYVENYFDDLNVQAEINNKLDEMATDGTLSTIINEKLFDDINIKINQLTPNFYLGAFHKKYSETDKRTYLYRSTDAYNFSKINGIELRGSKGTCGDPSIIFDEKSGWFLIAYSNQNLQGDDFSVTFSIYRSKDLINFENVDIRLNVPKEIVGFNKWAPDLFFNKDGELFVIVSIDKTWNGYDFELLISKCLDIETLNFETAQIINTNTNNNLYDGTIIYFKDLYYMLATNYDHSLVELYSSNDMINFTQINKNIFNIENPKFTNDAFEGCQFLISDDKLLMFAEMHDNQKIICGLGSDNNPAVLENQWNVPSLYKLKHGSITPIKSEKSKLIINNLTTEIINTSNKNVVDFSLGLINLTEDTVIDNLTIIPEQVYRINGNYNLTINNLKDPFNCREIKIIPNNTAGKLTINAYNDDSNFHFETNFSQYSKGKIITINAYFGFTSDNYSNTKDITNEIIFDDDFLNAFTINQNRWVIKNGILFFNMVLIAKTDNFSKLDCITMPNRANVGQKSYVGAPGSNNQLSIQCSSGSNTFNVDFVGTNGSWHVISGQILLNDFN